MDASPRSIHLLAPAAACAASAGIHAGLVVPHWHESHLLALSFVVSVLVLLAAALVAASSPDDGRARLASGLVLLGMCGAYAASRTTGLPLLAPEPEALDPVGVATQAVQLAGAVVAFLPIPREISWHVS
jgi:hypothetical protein